MHAACASWVWLHQTVSTTQDRTDNMSFVSQRQETKGYLSARSTAALHEKKTPTARNLLPSGRHKTHKTLSVLEQIQLGFPLGLLRSGRARGAQCRRHDVEEKRAQKCGFSDQKNILHGLAHPK